MERRRKNARHHRGRNRRPQRKSSARQQIPRSLNPKWCTGGEESHLEQPCVDRIIRASNPCVRHGRSRTGSCPRMRPPPHTRQSKNSQSPPQRRIRNAPSRKSKRNHLLHMGRQSIPARRSCLRKRPPKRPLNRTQRRIQNTLSLAKRKNQRHPKRGTLPLLSGFRHGEKHTGQRNRLPLPHGA